MITVSKCMGKFGKKYHDSWLLEASMILKSFKTQKFDTQHSPKIISVDFQTFFGLRGTVSLIIHIHLYPFDNGTSQRKGQGDGNWVFAGKGTGKCEIFPASREILN